MNPVELPSDIKPEHIPANLPLGSRDKHPLRYTFQGQHLLADLKTSIAAEPEAFHDGLKKFFGDELDKLSSHAAAFDLHIVDNPDGSISGVFHIKPIHLGVKKPAVAPAANLPDPAAAPAAEPLKGNQAAG